MLMDKICSSDAQTEGKKYNFFKPYYIELLHKSI